MPGRINSTTRLNRRTLDAMSGGLADGMSAIGQAWVDTVRPPDATPFGEGLVTTPDYGVWVNGRKVDGTARKPKRVTVKKGITLIAGEDFPGRFQELGTITNTAQPHVTPAMMAVLPNSELYLKPAVQKKLRGLP